MSYILPSLHEIVCSQFELLDLKALGASDMDYFGYEGDLHMSGNGNYVLAPTYPGSVSRRCPDLSKARKMLGFNPKIDWKEALKKTLDWYVSYYKENPKKRFICKDNKISNDKLVFLKAISNVIRSGMDIIGVDAPEKM